MAQSLSGRDDAVSNLEHILEQARSFGDEYTTAVLGRALGETYMRTGDLGSAEGHLNAALEYFRRNEMRPYMVQTLRTMETLYVRQGRDGDAQIASEEADRLQAQLAMNSSAPANAGDRTGSTSR
jgi:hypothetical protein